MVQLKSLSQNAGALLLRLEIEEFLSFEAELIDDRRYDEWLSLFADDLQYRMPLVRNLAASNIASEYLSGPHDVACFDEGKRRWPRESHRSRPRCIGRKSRCPGHRA